MGRAWKLHAKETVQITICQIKDKLQRHRVIWPQVHLLCLSLSSRCSSHMVCLLFLKWVNAFLPQGLCTCCLRTWLVGCCGSLQAFSCPLSRVTFAGSCPCLLHQTLSPLLTLFLVGTTGACRVCFSSLIILLFPLTNNLLSQDMSSLPSSNQRMSASAGASFCQ